MRKLSLPLFEPGSLKPPAPTHLASVPATLLMRFPFSITLLAVVSVVGSVMGAIGDRAFHEVLTGVGFDLDALRHARLYVLPLGPLIQDHAGFPWKIDLMLLALVPPLEFLAGSLKTAATFFLSDLISTIAATFVLWGAAALGSTRADVYVHTPDLGSSSGAFGCIAAFAASLNGPLRLVVLAPMAVFLAVELLVNNHVYSVEHIIAAALGFALGLLWSGGWPGRRLAPHHEHP